MSAKSDDINLIEEIMDKKIKQKIVLLSGQIKTKEVDGERRIVFVASSNEQDRHYEHVNVGSLRLPLKGGGEIKVEAIPEEGVKDIVDIPMMLNHSGDVRDVIGSVRSAWFVNDELIFEAGISGRDIAQDMLTLIEEGHLSNSFSITMIDYDYNYDAETISNAEVIEVSLVYRGSNKDARLLAIKSLTKGQEAMEDKTKQNDRFGDANGDGKDHTTKPEETTETPKAPAEGTQTEADDTTTNDNPEEEQTMENNKQIAKDTVVEKATAPTQAPKSTNGYLKTKQALVDFKNIVLKNHKGSNAIIMKEWMGHLKAKEITGDAIMPSRIENIFFKTWQDNPGILGTFRFIAVKNASVNAMSTEDTAKGHKKGETKANQTVANLRRDLRALAIYKKLPIDLQDLFDDETGELLAFRTQELAERIANAIAIGAILDKGTGNDATLQGGRGLYPMVDDINATGTDFGTKVATKLQADADDNEYDIAVKVTGAVKDKSGRGKVLIVPDGFQTKLRLMKDSTGHPLFPVGVSIPEALGVTLFEIEEMEGNDFAAIAYVNQAYVLVGEANGSVWTDFDLDTNKDIMLQERYVGGSLEGRKVAAGITPAA
jgi:hypothetical protein